MIGQALVDRQALGFIPFDVIVVLGIVIAAVSLAITPRLWRGADPLERLFPEWLVRALIPNRIAIVSLVLLTIVITADDHKVISRTIAKALFLVLLVIFCVSVSLVVTVMRWNWPTILITPRFRGKPRWRQDGRRRR
jgi:hypothetical protein